MTFYILPNGPSAALVELSTSEITIMIDALGHSLQLVGGIDSIGGEAEQSLKDKLSIIHEQLGNLAVNYDPTAKATIEGLKSDVNNLNAALKGEGNRGSYI